MANIDLRDASQFLNSDQIPNLMPCEVMRKSIENKNLLSAKGDLYVGTGESEDITIDEDIYTVAKTGKIAVPTDLVAGEEAILVYDQVNGLQYKAGRNSGFLAYNVAQKIADKDTLIDNMFANLTNDQKSKVRELINAGSAQGIAGVGAGDGISVSADIQRPVVSVKLDVTKPSEELTFSAENLSGLVVGPNGMRIGANVDKTTTQRIIQADSISVSYSQRSYPVQIANAGSDTPGKMFVYVPWSSSSYYAGTGLSLSGNTFNLKAPIYIGNTGTEQASKEIRFILT